MGIEICRVSEDDLGNWDRLVQRSPQATLFHQRDFLEVLETHSSAELHHLIGHKGQEPVGLFPLFELSKGPVRTTFSPPPRRAIPYLGPALLNHRKLKQRKFESLNSEFIEACVDYIDDVIGSRYTLIQTGIEYSDIRPFKWAGFDVEQRYTFAIDLRRGTEQLLDEFSRSTRRSLTADTETEFRVLEAGTDAIEFIHDQITARYEAQGRRFGPPLAFVMSLFEELEPGMVRPYIGEVEGEWASGIIALESDDVVYYFIGGGKPEVEFPINEHLHWTIIREAIDRGKNRYDLIGANQKNLANYKAKFNPDLLPWYEVVKANPALRVAAHLYKVIT